MRKRLMSLAALGLLGFIAAMFFGVSGASAATSGALCLANDTSVCVHGNGIGQQVSLSLSGNAMNVTRVGEGSDCATQLYSYHNASGDWLRIPNGANTINLSTTHDNRAVFDDLGDGILGSYANGCSSDINFMLTRGDILGYGLFAYTPSGSGIWDKWKYTP